ncbi:MAG TPA: cation-transporting P-type ATPase [Candidatus Paceibacterota bacterium]
MIWHKLPLPEIERELNTDYRSGLSSVEAQARFAQSGPNELPAGKREGWPRIFLRQFESPLIYVLIVAAVVVLLLGEVIDSLLIALVLIFNAIVGAGQEGRAENTMLALKKFTTTTATVIRDGKELIIPDREIVHGDIILLHEGDKVPADARLIEANTLRTQEASITGESKPIHKEPDYSPDQYAPISAQTNMLFKGTGIASGRGKAVVVATGQGTYLGLISQTISKIDTEIPLKRNIRKFSEYLIWGIGVFSLGLLGLGVFMGRAWAEMFSITVSLAVSVIPEGLPIVLTLILARGVWRMAKRNALVKKLQAVEALGEAKIIAVDKTGTLTRNELVIRNIYIDGKMFYVLGTGYEPKGEVKLNDNTATTGSHPELLLAGKVAAVCANARTAYSEENQSWDVSGDPTEASMFVLASKLGFDKDDVERETPLVAEIPFDYRLKYHATAHNLGDNRQFIAVVGAPESVLPLGGRIFENGKAEPLSREKREKLEGVFHHMSRAGLRVVAFGYKETNLPKSGEKIEVNDLVLAGFYGIEDSLRPEVPEAMIRAKSAGIKVVMITGDAKLTAIAIAKEAGIWQVGDEVLTDEDLEHLSENALQQRIRRTSVFARITPENKMKIIEAYRKNGQIVAMTGDGVNDAPSLVAADLGVAMGKIGTEVAREAADIILLDDNFGSIVSAVEEGRNMYATIQKVMLFLLSTSLGEVLVILGALLLGWPIPLSAPQILWMNLVTDSFVAFALALDSKEEGLLQASPVHKGKFLIDRNFLVRMFIMSAVMTFGGLLSFGLLYAVDLARAWTMTLTVLAMFQWLNGWNCRSKTVSVFEEVPWKNKYLVIGVGVAALLHVIAIYTPFFQKVLDIVPLNWREWAWCFAVAFLIIIFEELRKGWLRRIKKKRNLQLATNS